MRQLSWWIEWPAGPIRVGVVFLVAVTALAAAVRFPATFKRLGDTASRNSALSFADRDVAGGNELVVDQNAVYQARARIPRDATYNVAVGEDFQGGGDLTVPYVASYFHYFLIPRRPAEQAPWVVCYGCDLAEYGDDARVVWRSAEGISIVRVRR